MIHLLTTARNMDAARGRGFYFPWKTERGGRNKLRFIKRTPKDDVVLTACLYQQPQCVRLAGRLIANCTASQPGPQQQLQFSCYAAAPGHMKTEAARHVETTKGTNKHTASRPTRQLSFYSPDRSQRHDLNHAQYTRVEAKVSLCTHHGMKREQRCRSTYSESWNQGPTIFNKSENPLKITGELNTSRPDSNYHQGKNPGTLCTREWMCPRVVWTLWKRLRKQ